MIFIKICPSFVVYVSENNLSKCAGGLQSIMISCQVHLTLHLRYSNEAHTDQTAAAEEMKISARPSSDDQTRLKQECDIDPWRYYRGGSINIGGSDPSPVY